MNKLDIVGSSELPLWLIDPTRIPFLHAADFWIGALGFAITVATFVLGWRKLAKVQNSAKAAADAVRDLKLRVGRYDATIDAAEGLHALDEASRHLDAPDWRGIVQSMSHVRRAVIRMDHSLEAIDKPVASELRRASTKLDKHIRVIEKAMGGQVPYPEIYLIKLTIRSGGEAFVKAKRTLEENLT